MVLAWFTSPMQRCSGALLWGSNVTRALIGHKESEQDAEKSSLQTVLSGMAEGPQGEVGLQALGCDFAPSKQSWNVCHVPRLISIGLGISDLFSSDLAVIVVLVVTVVPVLDEAVAQTYRACHPLLVMPRGPRERGELMQSPTG